MSRVTSVIIVSSIIDSKVITVLNEWIVEHYGCGLKRVDSYAGGNKAMEVDVYAGAFNFLDVHKFKDLMDENLSDSRIVVIIKEEDSDIDIHRFKELL